MVVAGNATKKATASFFNIRLMLRQQLRHQISLASLPSGRRAKSQQSLFCLPGRDRIFLLAHSSYQTEIPPTKKPNQNASH